MKQLYIVLLNLSLIATYSVAKSEQNNIKHKHSTISIPLTETKHSSENNANLYNKFLIYRVKKGDTLYALALRSGSSVKRIKQLNHIHQTKKLKIGQMILLREKRVKKQKSTKKSFKIERELQEIKYILLTAYFQDKTIKSNKQLFTTIVADNNIQKRDKSVVLKSNKQITICNSPLKLDIAKKYLGKRYVWGANGPQTFDCSGFTKYVCNKSGISLPRTSIRQSKVGKRVSRANLKAGDLIFFDTSHKHRGYVNHVGIYIGNNKFIHASSGKRKVVITSLDKAFYKSRFKWGSRIES